jgi:hypothetical protein
MARDNRDENTMMIVRLIETCDQKNQFRLSNVGFLYLVPNVTPVGETLDKTQRTGAVTHERQRSLHRRKHMFDHGI